MSIDVHVTRGNWVSFRARGRLFLRTTLRDPTCPGGSFTIAQPLAHRYEVVDILAIGETTLLLRARDLRTRHRVLIKALRSDWIPPRPIPPDHKDAMTSELRRRRHLLQTERRLLVHLRSAGCAAVPHPNDYVHDQNTALECSEGNDRGDSDPLVEEALVATEPYLVLQHVAGVTLKDLLQQAHASSRDERHALEVIWPIVRTLEVLHQPWQLQSGRTWQCVYQDLKPSNILIDALGKPTLIDFSGCQVVIDGVPVLEGSCTPGYSAPECAEPGRVLMPCADVYSIGSILYQMITGIDPYQQLMRSPVQDGSLDLKALSGSASGQLRELLERCLATRPSDRYSDARQVAEALSRLVAA